MSVITDAFRDASSVDPSAMSLVIVSILCALVIVMLAWVIVKLGQQAIEEPDHGRDVFFYGIRATVLFVFVLVALVGAS